MRQAKSKPGRNFLTMLAAMVVLGGCSTFEGAPLVPTGSVRSPETSRTGEYPPVGVMPPAPAPALSPAERDRIRTELTRARDANRAAAQAPLEQPLPRRAEGEGQRNQ